MDIQARGIEIWQEKLYALHAKSDKINACKRSLREGAKDRLVESLRNRWFLSQENRDDLELIEYYTKVINENYHRVFEDLSMEECMEIARKESK